MSEGTNVAKSLRLIVQNLDKFRETVKTRFVAINERLDRYEKDIGDLRSQISKLATASPQPTRTNSSELTNLTQRLDALEAQLRKTKSNVMPLSPEIPATTPVSAHKKITPVQKSITTPTVPKKVPVASSSPPMPSTPTVSASSGSSVPSSSPPAPPSTSIPSPGVSVPVSKPQIREEKPGEEVFENDADGLLDALKKLDAI